MTFYEVLEQALALLQRHKRVSYRALKLQFHLLGDESLEALKDELIYQQVARDENGQGLVWVGEALPDFAPTAPVTTQSAISDAAANTSSAEDVRPPSLRPTAVPSTMPGAAPEPIRPSPEAERRQLTVMFCDLADSTKLSQQLDPENLREVIRAYQAAAVEVVQRFDGYPAQYLGDGLLIYFGWPQAHEDDPQRAVHTGLGIVEAITTVLNPRLEQEKGMQLAVRVGIHTGPVVVGEMGSAGRQEHLAMGETVNIAARLEGLAAPNTVVLSQVTARLVHQAFVLEDFGRHTLKGVVEPMQVFRVLGSMAVYSDEEEVTPERRRFLVGRDEEVGLLLRRWEQSKDGLGQVIFISGEAGIGKSSLVAAVRAHVVDEGYTRLTFRCSPYHTNSALYPVITHLEYMLGFEREDRPETRLDKLEQVLWATSLSLEESVPLMATLLSVPFGDRYPAPTLSPQQQRLQTLDILVGWLLEEAGHQPVLAMWEDLHWADPSTLEMLGLVLEQTPTVPMLHVLTFRPEFELPWPSRSHMTPITLNRLERLQVEALIAHLAGGKTLPAEVVEHIVAKTDGVPLYVEELTKMLLESDLLREEVEQYVLTGPLISVAIPDTLQDSLMARLDQLNQAKEVAQLGSVLGREFPYEMLKAISSQDDEALQSGLAQLVEAELLYQRGRPPRARYIFKHALVQDAAYASLLRSTRQQLHARVAQQLEAQFPKIAEIQPELVAHHLTEAGLREQAVDYWQCAGQRALQGSAHTEAIAHLTQALALLTTIQETPERLQQELTLQVALGPALIAIKGQAALEVERAYDRARELCQQLGDTPQLFPVLWGLMLFYQARGQLQTTYQLGEQLLQLAQSQSDPAFLMLAHHQLGAVLCYRGEPASGHTHHTRALAIYHPQEHRDMAVRYGFDLGVGSHRWLAWELWLLGFPAQARQHMHEALTMAQELSHPWSQAEALNFALMIHIACREGHAAYQRAEEAIALATELGFPIYASFGAILRGWALAALGHIAEGIPQMHQGLADFRSQHVQLFVPYFLGHLAEAHAKGEQPEAGLSLLAEALALVGKNTERFYEAELYRLQGELLLMRKATGETLGKAVASFHQALTVARRQQAKSWELRAAMSLARLWQQQDKCQDACDLLAPVYGWFTEGFDTADLQEAKALLDELR